MAKANSNRRSFFEWVIPDELTVGWLVRAFGILGLLFALILAFSGALTRHLSVNGGGDQITAGVPDVDDYPTPEDQIAAGVPALDDPSQIPSLRPSTSERVLEDEEENDEDISDEETDEQVANTSGLRVGTWNVTIRDSGEAKCGYSEEPLVIDGRIVIVPGENGQLLVRIELPWNVYEGQGNTMPLLTLAGTPAGFWFETRTIDEFDPDNGIIRTTGEYQTEDCNAHRETEAITVTPVLDF